jgi:hypothetical protein
LQPGLHGILVAPAEPGTDAIGLTNLRGIHLGLEAVGHARKAGGLVGSPSLSLGGRQCPAECRL